MLCYYGRHIGCLELKDDIKYKILNSAELIPNLFRTEYSKLVAVLCKVYGLSNIQVAEDIVSETFLSAAETWGKKGVPTNQVGWLYTVAKNKTKDHLRRSKIKIEKVDPALQRETETTTALDLDLSEKEIKDSQLKMIFASCHPSLSKDSQIALALRILCGFSIDEIVSALLSNKETINKKLYRAKTKLRENNISIDLPEPAEINARLDAVLKTLYLLFNEGYYSANPNKSIRKDLCLEAMRLNILLTDTKQTDLPKTNALLSLMCFHASRLEARLDDEGEYILYDQQDTSLWDNDLIKKGEHFLNRASKGAKLSKYHLEAAIAYWHTQKENEQRWESILQLYNYLLQIEYSPIAALNRTYALSKANSKQEAIKEALKLQLDDNHLYHMLLAELYKGENHKKRIKHLEEAYTLTKSDSEKKLIKRKLLEGNHH